MVSGTEILPNGHRIRSPAMPKHTIVVTHGVGDSPLGYSLSEVSKGLGLAPGHRSDVLIGGVTYPAMQIDHPFVSNVVEVNWSDVAKPSRSIPSVLDYLIRIAAAMLRVGAGLASRARTITRVYGWTVRALLGYCIYPPLFTMLIVTLPTWAGVLASIAGVLVASSVTRYLTRFGRDFRAGWIWTAVLAALALGYYSNWLPVGSLVLSSTVLYVLSQYASATMLFVVVVRVFCIRATPLDQRIAAVAFLYLPFFLLSTVGAVLWAAALWVVEHLPKADLRKWQDLYEGALKTLKYDLALIEFGFAAVVASVGLGLIFVALLYWRRDIGKNRGLSARNGARSVLAIGALLFLFFSVTIVYADRIGWHPFSGRSPLEVYAISALRFVPYLALTTGPLSIVAGIIVDVLFYVVDDRDLRDRPLSTAATLRNRFLAALRYAKSLENPVIVAAHSQGSVIAIDALTREAPAGVSRIVTAGSPLASLYRRFLDSTPESRAEVDRAPFAAPVAWTNFSRWGDYIGAAQEREGAVTEEDLGAGGHGGYWREHRLWDSVLTVRDTAIDPTIPTIGAPR
jgi:hypothetical protein